MLLVKCVHLEFLFSLLVVFLFFFLRIKNWNLSRVMFFLQTRSEQYKGCVENYWNLRIVRVVFFGILSIEMSKYNFAPKWICYPLITSNDCLLSKMLFDEDSYYSTWYDSGSMTFSVWDSRLNSYGEDFFMGYNLIKRGIIVVEWCCMCKCSGEAVDHLLFHSRIACKSWTFFPLYLAFVRWCLRGEGHF